MLSMTISFVYICAMWSCPPPAQSGTCIEQNALKWNFTCLLNYNYPCNYFGREILQSIIYLISAQGKVFYVQHGKYSSDKEECFQNMLGLWDTKEYTFSQNLFPPLLSIKECSTAPRELMTEVSLKVGSFPLLSGIIRAIEDMLILDA